MMYAMQICIHLRQKRNDEMQLSEEDKSARKCPYHRLDTGCVLEELKSPLCISGYCRDGPSGLDGTYARLALIKILKGGYEPLFTAAFNPHENDSLVKEFTTYVGALTESCRHSNL